jgi:hypothetical protein
MTKETIGKKAHRAMQDTSSYCAFEIGAEQAKDIEAQVFECIERHKDTFDSDSFCVVMLIARDPTLCNLIRRKFYAWPFLPKPRTSQVVWLYNKNSGNIKMLWCLPYADTMAMLSNLLVVDPAYKNMKRWSDYFYTTRFWPKIRAEHNITMLSEEEHLDVIRKEGAKSLGDDISPSVTNPFDLARIESKKVINS